jgi:hypothetical protein
VHQQRPLKVDSTRLPSRQGTTGSICAFPPKIEVDATPSAPRVDLVDRLTSRSRWPKGRILRSDSGQNHRLAERRAMAAKRLICITACRVRGERSACAPRLYCRDPFIEAVGLSGQARLAARAAHRATRECRRSTETSLGSLIAVRRAAQNSLLSGGSSRADRRPPKGGRCRECGPFGSAKQCLQAADPSCRSVVAELVWMGMS